MKQGLEIWRDEFGIPHIEAENLPDMYWGNGYVHARDRGMQMLLMRILGQGRASEILDSSDDTLAVDLFFRRMNWYEKTKEQFAELQAEKKQYLQSYSEGVNAAFAEKYPWVPPAFQTASAAAAIQPGLPRSSSRQITSVETAAADRRPANHDDNFQSAVKPGNTADLTYQ